MFAGRPPGTNAPASGPVRRAVRGRRRTYSCPARRMPTKKTPDALLRAPCGASAIDAVMAPDDPPGTCMGVRGRRIGGGPSAPVPPPARAREPATAWFAPAGPGYPARVPLRLGKIL